MMLLPSPPDENITLKIITAILLILINLALPISSMTAATIPLSLIPVGKVVSVNGLKFVKIADNQYLAATTYGTMQSWDGCASLPNPACVSSSTCTTTTTKSQLFTPGPTLMDVRDGKQYEIRKFPDGKCWMVDNLAYGGTTTVNGNVDACAGKATFVGEGQATPYVSWYQGSAQLYGDCRDAAATGYGAVSAPCLNTTACGYFYNWQAAMQLAAAYHNSVVSYPHGIPSPTNYIQGICPDGWHLPSGGSDTVSEFIVLDQAVGGNGTNGQNGHNYTTFWRPSSFSTTTNTDPWKAAYAGDSYPTGELMVQETYGDWWSSTQDNLVNTYFLATHQSHAYPQHVGDYEHWGFSIRCIKN
jgi:uncharacterized protein (TIGR02145 family)